MKLTQEELIDVISDVTTMLGDILAAHVELTESLVGQGAGVEAQKLKLNSLKARLADEKLKLQKLRDAQQRKRELEKIRKDHEREASKTKQTEGKSTQTRIALLNAKGQWIGWIETQSSGRVNVYDARGRIVARELNGITLDRTGRVAAWGGPGQGLRVIGQTLLRCNCSG